MKIKILGTRGEIQSSAPYHSKHSGILLDGKFLFDLGEKAFLTRQLKSIFITHLHPDHAFFVRKENAKINIPAFIYAPEKCKNFNIRLLKTSKRINAYKITPIPTIHSLKVKSQAYLIEKAGEKILYTGDMIWIEKKYHKLLENIDLVITEASYIRQKGLIKRHKATGKIYGHTGIPDLMKLFSQFTRRIIFVHFGTWFYKDTKKAHWKVQKLAEKYGVMAYIGYDGMDVNTKKSHGLLMNSR